MSKLKWYEFRWGGVAIFGLLLMGMVTVIEYWRRPAPPAVTEPMFEVPVHVDFVPNPEDTAHALPWQAIVRVGERQTYVSGTDEVEFNAAVAGAVDVGLRGRFGVGSIVYDITAYPGLPALLRLNREIFARRPIRPVSLIRCGVVVQLDELPAH